MLLFPRYQVQAAWDLFVEQIEKARPPADVRLYMNLLVNNECNNDSLIWLSIKSIAAGKRNPDLNDYLYI